MFFERWKKHVEVLNQTNCFLLFGFVWWLFTDATIAIHHFWPSLKGNTFNLRIWKSVLKKGIRSLCFKEGSFCGEIRDPLILTGMVSASIFDHGKNCLVDTICCSYIGGFSQKKNLHSTIFAKKVAGSWKKRNRNFSILAVISTSWRMSTSDLGIQIPGEENLSFLRQWRWNSLGWKDLWLERQWWRRFRVAWRIPLNWSELVRFKLQVTENWDRKSVV